VDFVDKTVLALGDPASRASVFSSDTLAAILEAAYDADRLSVEGPYTAVFDQFRLAFAVTARATVEGGWMPTGGIERSEVLLRVAGVFAGQVPVADALWRGAVVARAVVGQDRIEEVAGGMSSLGGIDDEIVAMLGSLPGDSAALESERRKHLLERLRDGADQPGAIDNEVLDRWLRGAGVATVSELVTRAATTGHGGTFGVTYSAPAGGAPVPRQFPVVVALLVRGPTVSIASLLTESKLLRERLEESGVELPADPALPRRQAIVVGWVLPDSLFDDDGWPGAGTGGSPASRRARRECAAQAWLKDEGIALVPRAST
jgi:hypothetical protein